MRANTLFQGARKNCLQNLFIADTEVLLGFHPFDLRDRRIIHGGGFPLHIFVVDIFVVDFYHCVFEKKPEPTRIDRKHQNRAKKKMGHIFQLAPIQNGSLTTKRTKEIEGGRERERTKKCPQKI